MDFGGNLEFCTSDAIIAADQRTGFRSKKANELSGTDAHGTESSGSDKVTAMLKKKCHKNS